MIPDDGADVLERGARARPDRLVQVLDLLADAGEADLLRSGVAVLVDDRLPCGIRHRLLDRDRG